MIFFFPPACQRVVSYFSLRAQQQLEHGSRSMPSPYAGSFHVKLTVTGDDKAVNNPENQSEDSMSSLSLSLLALTPSNECVMGTNPQDGGKQTERKNVFTRSPLERDPVIYIHTDMEMKAACLSPL